MKPSGPLYLEDLVVGQTFRTGSVTIDEARLKAFAAEFDPQPFHLDAAAAGSSLFGGLVASGWHTAALTMRLMVEGDFKVAGGLIGVGVDQIRWPKPVFPGMSSTSKAKSSRCGPRARTPSAESCDSRARPSIKTVKW